MKQQLGECRPPPPRRIWCRSGWITKFNGDFFVQSYSVLKFL